MIPKSIADSVIKIGDIELRCHILNNGQRIIEAEDVENFMKYLSDGGELTPEQAEEIAKFAKL